ncbi:DUF4291 domain-containing protein [Nannocystis bainbridge]|uniref:DUF4291 domain-containing protein n=1 Tax=Nannocystis bainbridge TaxID=2995303 RepID=A0ABT5EAN2_9BACT|nr:DUF4291 domain-containing protein [Nannocystis bainbridge]MDC0722655.1 DUF4291 domain-containing protein [Nannocystis bainbridge]
MNPIRADFDARTIVVYQAYGPAIARPAIAAKRFVPPFSRTRMTWIKPSFLWLMERSNWGQKSGQEHILAVRISRAGWEEALAAGVLTSRDPRVDKDPEAWQARFEAAAVHIQWDPERSLRGATLNHNSIQVGLSRHIIDRFVDAWTVDITDLTPLVRKIHGHLKAGQEARAKALLPPERPYPLPPALARTLGATA